MEPEHETQHETVEIAGRQYRVHEAAAVFPIMTGREFEELVEDVRTNGLREPVVVIGDHLLDGRNRLRACAAAGVAPAVRELESEVDPVAWVTSVNVHRRHLDASQRALLASRLCALSREMTLSRASEVMAVSRSTICRAVAVEKGPEPLKAAVDAGLVSVGDAYELRGEDPETIEVLVDDVRAGAAPHLRGAMRQRGIKPKPRKKDPRGRKPKARPAAAERPDSDAGESGGGITLGQLVDPDEAPPPPGPRPTDDETESLLPGTETPMTAQETSDAEDLRTRARVALGGHVPVEASNIDEGAPWPSEGGVFWTTGEADLDEVAERIVACVKTVSAAGGVVVGGPVDVRSAPAQRLMALPELTAVSFEREPARTADGLPRMLWGFRVDIGDFRQACDGFGVVLEMAAR